MSVSMECKGSEKVHVTRHLTVQLGGYCGGGEIWKVAKEKEVPERGWACRE